MKVLTFPLLTMGLAVGAGATDCESPSQWTKQMSAPLTMLGTCDGPNRMTEPPQGAIVVDASATHPGSFKTISEGVSHIPNTTDTHTLFIFRGIYSEQVVIPLLAGPLVVQGYTCNPMTYTSNTVTITSAKSSDDIPPETTNDRNLLSSTMAILSKKGVKVLNLNIENTASKDEDRGRAGAIYAAATNIGVYGCRIMSQRGALTANRGYQIYSQNLIQGAENLVSGKWAMAWLQSCQIVITGKGWVTANGNNQSEILSEFVLDDAAIYSLEGARNITYLGRPWGQYARTIIQNSRLDVVVKPEGWTTFKKESTEHVYFKEFNNTGSSAATDKRVAFSGQLDKARLISEVLGPAFESEFFYESRLF